MESEGWRVRVMCNVDISGPCVLHTMCVCVFELTLLLLLMTPNTAITELFTNSTLSGTHQLVWCLGSPKAHCVGGTPLGWSHGL